MDTIGGVLKEKCNTFCRKVQPTKIYQHLATQERVVVTTMHDVLCSIRAIAQRLCCSVSTASFAALAGTTRTVVDSITAVLNGEPAAMCKMMTCDQGHEMYGHKIFTERTGLRIDSVVPHGPWQRGQPERQWSAAPVPLLKHRFIDFLSGRFERYCAVAQYAFTAQD